MNLHVIHDAVPAELGEALERFERQFTYPLGSGGTFRISHGRDYLPFFAAMGPCTLFVAEHKNEVLGTLVRVERWMEFGDDSLQKQRAHYLADLKICPAARGGRVLARLIMAAREEILPSGSHSCYGIVMDGTAALPEAYTGRLGIPVFEKLAAIMILRIAAATPTTVALTESPLSSEPGATCVVTGGNRALRSLMQPVRLPGGAWLEDTRRGKRLWTSGETELLSAHLTSFRFDDPAAGASVIRHAVEALAAASLPALFTAVPLSRYGGLRAELSGLEVAEAPATVYGCNLRSDCDWWVDTAEI